MNQGERILLVDLLKVLHRYSDEDNGIRQKEIIGILEDEYGYENLYARRKTVKNNLDKVLEFSKCSDANEILYRENIRKEEVKDKDGNKSKIRKSKERSDFRFIHDFTHGELRLIIDGILFSKQIPSNQRGALIEKLEEKLASKYFDSRLKHIHRMSSDGPINHDLFYNIEIIDEAISKHQQITFQYKQYDLEGKKIVLNPRLDQEGVPREYVINPYQIVATNGRYYLICNNDQYDDISHYRLDRIANIRLTDGQRKPINNVKGFEHGLDLSKHMKEHIYMFAGNSVSVRLRFDKRVLDEFVDWFGTEQIDFSGERENEVTARVRVNYNAMRKWALQYALHVKVLSPDRLVADMKEDIQKAMENYE